MNGCAPGLALIERLKATRKWAIFSVYREELLGECVYTENTSEKCVVFSTLFSVFGNVLKQGLPLLFMATLQIALHSEFSANNNVDNFSILCKL